MKVFSTVLLSLLFVVSLAIEADDVVGKWYTVSENSQVEIYKVGKEFKGKIVALKNPNFEADHPTHAGKPKVDLMNPDEKKRTQSLIGMELIKGFNYNEGEKRWVNGNIYNPEDGKLYYCSLQLDNPTTLRVRGSLDAWGFLGKTQLWIKVK